MSSGIVSQYPHPPAYHLKYAPSSTDLKQPPNVPSDEQLQTLVVFNQPLSQCTQLLPEDQWKLLRDADIPVLADLNGDGTVVVTNKCKYFYSVILSKASLKNMNMRLMQAFTRVLDAMQLTIEVKSSEELDQSKEQSLNVEDQVQLCLTEFENVLLNFHATLNSLRQSEAERTLAKIRQRQRQEYSIAVVDRMNNLVKDSKAEIAKLIGHQGSQGVDSKMPVDEMQDDSLLEDRQVTSHSISVEHLQQLLLDI